MTLSSFLMNTTIDFNLVVYRNADFSDPLVLFPFIWMLLALLVNVGVALDALSGRLINPRITKQVVIGCAFGACWMIVYIVQSYVVTHRVVMIMAVWMGLILGLIIALQHVELLKLFVCLSDYWTVEKCIIYQKCWIGFHFTVTMACYIWPLGLETNSTATLIYYAGTLAQTIVGTISNYSCAFISINLMWKHLKDSKRRNGNRRLPMARYWKAIIMILIHAFFDILAIVALVISTRATSTVIDYQLNYMLSRLSLTMLAFHVAFFPFVFKAVKDLKFHEQITIISTANSRSKWIPLKKVKAIFSSKKPGAKSNEMNTEPTYSPEANHETI